MMPPSEPEQQPANLQQDVEGSQNQVIGQVSGGTVIGNFYQAPGTPSIADEIKARPLNPRSPYMGLRKFEVRDKDLFFGRDQLIGRLLERLEDSPFLLILGSSGSGKSSLVRAGLIPGLRERLGAGFRELIFTPDRDPFDSLRSCLRSAGFRQADLASLQASHPETLLQTVQAVKPTDEEWLIFIDQFEELFTLCQDLQIRQAVIDGLIQLVQAKLLGMRLVLAMRADFLDRLGAYPQLSGVLKQADQMTDKDKSGILQWAELITDMSSDELRLAIEQPAAHHGVLLEPELTEAIIHDLKGQLNTASAAERVSLPLLQYTLKLLWENSDLSDRTLRLSTYSQLGGVRGALQRHMDEIY
ncbi:MAG TPA: AAA family ATPase, partial [Coleofasciculaceae cyanobacterium]